MNGKLASITEKLKMMGVNPVILRMIRKDVKKIKFRAPGIGSDVQERLR